MLSMYKKQTNNGDLERGAELWYACSMVDYRNSAGDNEQGRGKDLKVRHNSLQVSIRLEPIMLKNLPIIPSRTSKKFYPLFLIHSQIITCYSFIILLDQ